MSDHSEFCTQCGAKLNSNNHFCPECGAGVPGMNPEKVKAEKEAIRESIKGRLGWAGIMILVYSVPFLIMGLYYLFDSTSIANALWNNSTIHQQLINMGWTFENLKDYLMYFGAGWLISGATGIIAAVACFKRTNYYVAMIFCLISALFAITGIFAFLLGFLAFWFIMSSKLGFKENEAELEEQLNTIE
ncbi:MAG: zinc-ribbon domain-containing protein [Candidatus Methanomethylophilaceae archaeon]|nr:zinc-ribbon domain-containing protein [Candidatus Methanomethylophilaceae archaeon]MDD3378892.1 zinc-ribbon domain-containing protein [Candidatus Methanomethylophilaceae archaeon]MDY0223911.1 zinc-ribbon domain-containing protein [Candidatus Methanomethylophilaceae archaeon]